MARFFQRDANQRVLEKLFNAGVLVQEVSRKQTEAILRGKTFVFTGRLENLTRREAQNRRGSIRDKIQIVQKQQ